MPHSTNPFLKNTDASQAREELRKGCLPRQSTSPWETRRERSEATTQTLPLSDGSICADSLTFTTRYTRIRGWDLVGTAATTAASALLPQFTTLLLTQQL